MEKKRFSEIHCPQCGKEFRIRKGKPRTLAQWKIALFEHLTISTTHTFPQEKAESIITKYFKSLDSTFS